MGKLILVRHGQTNKNLDNLLHSVNDLEVLNETGKSQIEKVVGELKKFSPCKVFSSNEQRAIESAEIISSLLKIPLEIVRGMEERNWGVFTDKPWSDVQAELSSMSLEERFNYIPKNGESWKFFESRLIGAIESLTKNNMDKTIIVVTHGGAIRALIPYLLNIPKEESFKYDPSNASLTIFDFDKTGFHKVLVNDISHL